MGLSVNINSLSALNPVKLTYRHASDEKLASEIILGSNGIVYYKHAIFENFKDASLSRKNCLVLTDVKDLNDVFETQAYNIEFGTIAGCIFLKNSAGKYLTTLDNQIYVGGTGQKLFLNVIPSADGSVYLKFNKTSFVEFDDSYPYPLRISDETIVDEQLYTRKFYIDYVNGKASFKVKTNEGFRFVSFGVDKVVRAVGLELNDTVVNQYHLNVEFITESSVPYNTDSKMKQVQYFNEFESTDTRKTLEVKSQSDKHTNLLVTCATTQINLSAAEAFVNIAPTKTNFTSFGTYNT